MEGESKKETLELLREAIVLLEEAKEIIPEEKFVPTTTIISVQKKEIEGIIEVTSDGRPQIVVPPEKLSAKDVIGLFLHWKYPGGLSIGELTNLISLSWKAVPPKTVAARIAEMKGQILKEGQKGKYIYKLSGAGKSWVETTLLPELKSEKK